MAQRVRVDTSTLRSKNQGTRVIARPVDTFSSVGNQVDTDPKGLQVANALAKIEPSISKYFDAKIQAQNKEDSAAGLKEYLESDPDARKRFRLAIKSGQIDEIQSPFFVKGLTQAILKEKSREFGSKLVLEWNQKKDNSGFDTTKFIADSQQLFIEENGLAQYDVELFASEFAPRAENYANIVGQRQYEHKIKRARQARVDLIGSDMIDAYQNNVTELGGLQPTAYIKDVNRVIQGVINEGLDPSTAIQAAVGHLEALALGDDTISDSEVYQDALANLKVKGGVYSQTGKGAKFLRELDDKVDGKVERMENQEDTAEEDLLKEQAQEQFVSFAKQLALSKNPETWVQANEQEMLEANINPYFYEFGQKLKTIANQTNITPTNRDAFSYLTQLAATGALSIDDVRAKAHLLSADDFSRFVGMTTSAAKGQNLTNVLGADYSKQFVNDVTKMEDPTAIQKMMLETQGRGAYDSLISDAQFAANEVLMDLLGDDDFTKGLGNFNGNRKFKDEFLKRLEKLKTEDGGFNDRREAIKTKGVEVETVARIEEEAAVAKNILTDAGMTVPQIAATAHLPPLTPATAQKEAARPNSTGTYEVTWKEGDITPFAEMNIGALDRMKEQYLTVKKGEGGTLQAWEQSEAWVMMKQMGLNEAQFGKLINEAIVLKGPIEKAESEAKALEETNRQVAELTTPIVGQDDEVINANELDAIDMHGPDKVAKYKAEDPLGYLAKLQMETMQPDFVAFEAVPFEPTVVVDEQTQLVSDIITAFRTEGTTAVQEALRTQFGDLDDVEMTNMIMSYVPRTGEDVGALREQVEAGFAALAGSSPSPQVFTGVADNEPSVGTNSMQSPVLTSSTTDGDVTTNADFEGGVEPLADGMLARMVDKGFTPDAEDAAILRASIRKQKEAEIQDRIDLENQIKLDEEKARTEARNEQELLALREEKAAQRKERQRIFLEKRQAKRIKDVIDLINQKAVKYPDRFGMTDFDATNENTYMAKTAPLWDTYWEAWLPDGEEIPDAFWVAFKENLRTRKPN